MSTRRPRSVEATVAGDFDDLDLPAVTSSALVDDYDPYDDVDFDESYDDFADEAFDEDYAGDDFADFDDDSDLDADDEATDEAGGQLTSAEPGREHRAGAGIIGGFDLAAIAAEYEAAVTGNPVRSTPPPAPPGRRSPVRLQSRDERRAAAAAAPAPDRTAPEGADLGERFWCGHCGRSFPVHLKKTKNRQSYCGKCVQSIPDMSLMIANTFDPTNLWDFDL